MDRISGLTPQVGWSPLLSMVPQKKAPATTVEPAATAANTNSGLGAEVGSRAQGERVVQLQARNRDVTVETAVLAQSRAEAVPDPDAPTGPPPTFDVSPLEANAAALRAVPPKTAATEATVETVEPPPESETVAAETEAQTSAPAPEMAEAAPPQAAPEPEPKPERAAAHASSDWQASSDTAEPSLDVVR